MHTQAEIWKQSHVSSKLNLKVQLSFIFMCCTVKIDTTIQNLQNCEIVMFRPVTQAHRHVEERQHGSLLHQDMVR